MKFAPDRVKQILHSSRHLKKLLADGDKQQRILNLIKELLDKQVADHCQSASLTDNRLRLFTDSTIWASRLRFQSQALKQQLAAHGLNISQIDVRVSLDALQKPVPRKKPARPVLSSSAARLIMETAEGFDNDPELAAALTRLAAKSRKP